MARHHRQSALPLHAPSTQQRSSPGGGRFKKKALTLLGLVLLGVFMFNFMFLQRVSEGEELEAAAVAEMGEPSSAKATHELSEAEQESLEAEALAEAIAAPLIGPDGEDRTAPAPRSESGAGRRDDVHTKAALPPPSHLEQAVELPSDPEMPVSTQATRRCLCVTLDHFLIDCVYSQDTEETIVVGPPPPPQPSPPVPPPGQGVVAGDPYHGKGTRGQRLVHIGDCGTEGDIVETLVTKQRFEEQWGGCWEEGGREVLVALPFSAEMLCELRKIMFTQLKAMECANPGFNLRLGLYDKSYTNDMNAAKTKKSGRGVLATLRNALLAEYLKPEHELVIWLDADVVQYPPDMVSALYAVNPGGVVAPTVLIEESDTPEFHKHLCKKSLCHMGMQRKTRSIRQWSDKRYKQFYDRAAFIASNTNITTNRAFPGNSLPFPPYLGGVEGWTEGLETGKVECESVGTVYMLPASVYRTTSVATQEHGPHFPTAFTEHFPAVHAAKYELGVSIVTATKVVALHANLPKYGLTWHKEPMKDIWDEWLKPYLGKSLADPALVHTYPPSWWDDSNKP